jgi:hypothetical protein
MTALRTDNFIFMRRYANQLFKRMMTFFALI